MLSPQNTSEFNSSNFRFKSDNNPATYGAIFKILAKQLIFLNCCGLLRLNRVVRRRLQLMGSTAYGVRLVIRLFHPVKPSFPLPSPPHPVIIHDDVFADHWHFFHQ